MSQVCVDSLFRVGASQRASKRFDCFWEVQIIRDSSMLVNLTKLMKQIHKLCISVIQGQRGSYYWHRARTGSWKHAESIKPKSVIRPKQGNHQDIIASFQLLSAFLSASCFHLRFDIARYAFNAGCRSKHRQDLESNDRFGIKHACIIHDLVFHAYGTLKKYIRILGQVS